MRSRPCNWCGEPTGTTSQLCAACEQRRLTASARRARLSEELARPPRRPAPRPLPGEQGTQRMRARCTATVEAADG